MVAQCGLHRLVEDVHDGSAACVADSKPEDKLCT